MEKDQINNIMDSIVDALEEKGYDAHAQLCGYLQTGNLTFITKHKGARIKAENLAITDVAAYVLARYGI